VMPAGVMEVVGDRNRLRQVLTNLVENAIAYTDAGKIAVRYWREGDRVHIEVEDSGKGISEEHQERVFDRFYRVDPARSRKSGGSGLGLSIVKQILHAHDQPIHLESTIGEGSRFWFAIPHGSTGEWGESEEDAGATGSKELAESEQGERA
ncbi:MAG: ATP-binding protein, partial [Bacteroidota bacterium]